MEKYELWTYKCWISIFICWEENICRDNSIDYKNFCFNGETKFIRITKLLNDKNNTYLHNHYDLNWKLNELESGLRGYKRNPNIIIEKTKKCKINVKIC